MPADSRPEKVNFSVEKVTGEEFDQIAAELQQHYDMDFDHIERFRENHILAYEGPKTCLTCHQEIEV